MINYVILFLIHGLTSSQISNDDIHQYLVQLHYMQMLPISIDSVGSNLKYVHVTDVTYSHTPMPPSAMNINFDLTALIKEQLWMLFLVQSMTLPVCSW